MNILGLTTGANVRTIEGPAGGILSLAFMPDGKHRVAVTEPGPLRVRDVATGSVPHAIAAHDGSIRAFAFSPDGKPRAIAGHDRTIKIRDAR